MTTLPELDDEVAGRPLWQWLVIILVGGGIGYLLTQDRGGDPVPSATSLVDPITGLQYGADPIGGLVTGQDFAAPYAGQDSFLAPGGRDATNRDWMRDASVELYGRFGAALVDTALRKYLNGQALTNAEVGVINAALLSFGPPPDGAPSIDLVSTGGSTSPTTTTTTGTTTTTSTSTTTAQRIRDLFSKYCLARPSNDRLNRLIREVESGQRTLADIDRSLSRESLCSNDPAPLSRIRSAAVEAAVRASGISYGSTVEARDVYAAMVALRLSPSNPPTNRDVDRLLAAT